MHDLGYMARSRECIRALVARSDWTDREALASSQKRDDHAVTSNGSTRLPDNTHRDIA
jgi:hypothetical protein